MISGVDSQMSVSASVMVANPNTEIFIRETCNGVYKIIIRKKGILWFKSEESFINPESALQAVEILLADMGGFNSPLTTTSTTSLLPEPNATKVFKVVSG